jgi:predicted amidophosphoribosyltransferase
MKATRQLCAACGAEITRSTGLALCASCAVLAHDAFERAHRGADPTTRQRAWAAFFGGRNASAIEAARQARAVAV